MPDMLTRPWTARGAAVEHIRTARSHVDHPTGDRAGPFRDVPCARQLAAGLRGFRDLSSRISRLPAVWMSGRGVAQFRCNACRLDRLVAFSRKGRGFCPRLWRPADGRAVGAGAALAVTACKTAGAGPSRSCSASAGAQSQTALTAPGWAERRELRVQRFGDGCDCAPAIRQSQCLPAASIMAGTSCRRT